MSFPPVQQSGQHRESLPAPNEVHIWYGWLDRSSSYLDGSGAMLSAEERERAEHVCNARDRQHFVMSRTILREIVASYLGIEAPQCQFCYGTWGKPMLAAAHKSELRFNVSHSDGLAMYAITNGLEVGIDVERVRFFTEMEPIARRFFSPQEKEVLDEAPLEVRQELFFRYWTCKEALVKVMGERLLHSLQRVVIGSLPCENGKLLNSEDKKLWHLQALPSPQGYVSALALDALQRKPPYTIARSCVFHKRYIRVK